MKKRKPELFEDIKIIIRKGRPDPLFHTVASWGWKFNYKGNQYGNYIDNAIYGKPHKSGGCIPIIGTRDIKPEEQIELFGKMVDTMKLLTKDMLKKSKDNNWEAMIKEIEGTKPGNTDTATSKRIRD